MAPRAGDACAIPQSVVAALHLSEPGGPSRSLQPVLERLAERGARVTVAVPQDGRAAEELAGVARVEVLGHSAVTIPRRPHEVVTALRRGRCDVRRFRALLRRERAELAIVSTTTLPALTLAARLERVPSIVYAAELYRQGSRGDGIRRRIGGAALAANAAMASVTVPCSHAVAEMLPGRAKRVVVYPAIATRVGDNDAAAFRHRHRLPEHGPYLATMGNLARGRGQDLAIRALVTLRHEHPDAQLLIAGDPHPRPADREYARELIALAEELAVRDAVHFCGFARPGDVFAVADVFVNPARFAETFGIVAAEALVANVPVVSTCVGAVPEVLQHEQHALLVAPDRPDAIAAAANRLLRDPALAARLVEEGRQHVRSQFSAERQLPRFDAAITMALDGR